MKNRTPYHCDNKKMYTDTIGSMRNTYRGQPTKKPTLEALSDRVKLRYDEYDLKFNANDLIQITRSNWSEEEKEALIYLYESNSRIVSNLKVEIKETQDEHLRQICPNCGILPALEVDHYVPKELYPDFSIYSRNLIWSCKTCNGKKLQYWKEATYRGIINFYIDDIPSFNFLGCKVTSNKGILKASFFIKEHKLTNHPNIIKHFDRLKILDLYRDHIPTKLGEIIADLKVYKDEIDERKVKRILLKQYLERRNSFGINDWKVCILREVILRKHYLQYI